jgi:hypothetical protein
MNSKTLKAASEYEARHQLIFYRCGTGVTARWAAIRRTAGVGDHIINRRMSVGDAMLVLDRGQCREGGAENNCSGKRSYFYPAEHFLSPPRATGDWGTVLRHRQRSSTREQRGHNRESPIRGH